MLKKKKKPHTWKKTVHRACTVVLLWLKQCCPPGWGMTHLPSLGTLTYWVICTRSSGVNICSVPSGHLLPLPPPHSPLQTALKVHTSANPAFRGSSNPWQPFLMLFSFLPLHLAGSHSSCKTPLMCHHPQRSFLTVAPQLSTDPSSVQS